MIRSALAVGLTCLVMLPATACDGASPRHSRATTPAAARPSAPSSVTPSPPPDGAALKRALLPRKTFRGHRRYGPGSGSVADLVTGRLGAAVGIPSPPRSCRTLARTLWIDRTKVGTAVLDGPYAEVTYVHGPGLTANMAFETITALPAGVPADATGVRVSPGCKRYTVRWKGTRTSVAVAPLDAGALPRLDGAVVTGLRSTLDIAGEGRTRIRTLSVRSGSLLMLITVGGTGDVAGRTAKTATAAWTYARRRLGPG